MRAETAGPVSVFTLAYAMILESYITEHTALGQGKGIEINQPYYRISHAALSALVFGPAVFGYVRNSEFLPVKTVFTCDNV